MSTMRKIREEKLTDLHDEIQAEGISLCVCSMKPLTQNNARQSI